MNYQHWSICTADELPTKLEHIRRCELAYYRYICTDESLFTLACFGYHAIGVRYTVIYFSQPACNPLLKYDEPFRFSLPLDTTHLRYSAISVGFVQLSCRSFIFSFN